MYCLIIEPVCQIKIKQTNLSLQYFHNKIIKKVNYEKEISTHINIP